MSAALTRAERNHNPLNINYMQPSKAWNGQVGIEILPPGSHETPRFGRYVDDFHGIRASFKQLIVDNARHGLRTIKALVSDPEFGWAPAADRNDDAAYIKTVCEHSGYAADEELDFSTPAGLQSLLAIWPGFCIEENGRNPYASSLINQACRDALGITDGATS